MNNVVDGRERSTYMQTWDTLVATAISVERRFESLFGALVSYCHKTETETA